MNAAIYRLLPYHRKPPFWNYAPFRIGAWACLISAWIKATRNCRAWRLDCSHLCIPGSSLLGLQFAKCACRCFEYEWFACLVLALSWGIPRDKRHASSMEVSLLDVTTCNQFVVLLIMPKPRLIILLDEVVQTVTAIRRTNDRGGGAGVGERLSLWHIRSFPVKWFYRS